EPFRQDALNEVLLKALTQPSLRNAWAENARYYADTQDLYSLPEKAADIITGDLDG
ncbi:glycosyltransferase family 1 protein, partial [Salmonella enterica]|nr:glycosyltransferase family 1 protein [Salmonella enterica]